MAYLLPLASSLLYVLAVLFLKQANDRGVGLWRTTVVTNLLVGLHKGLEKVISTMGTHELQGYGRIFAAFCIGK